MGTYEKTKVLEGEVWRAIEVVYEAAGRAYQHVNLARTALQAYRKSGHMNSCYERGRAYSRDLLATS